MKKLELKHLSPYLPYELYGVIFYTETDFEKTKLCINDGLNNEADIASWILGTYQVKPILRPLSDLTKEIEVNGEKFVPYKKIKEIYPFDTFSSSSNPAQWSLRVVEKLLEWHFDVFGLIDDLAIDINTL